MLRTHDSMTFVISRVYCRCKILSRAELTISRIDRPACPNFLLRFAMALYGTEPLGTIESAMAESLRYLCV